MRSFLIALHRRIGPGLLACAVIVSAAPARTWRVEKDGSGDFTVIQDALDAAAEGDSVLIGPGRYEDFRFFDWTPEGGVGYAIIGVHKSNLTVVGTDSATVFIGPSVPTSDVAGEDSYGIVVNHNLDGAKFENLTIENARWGAALVSFGSFSACRFQGNTWRNLYVDGDGIGMAYTRCTFTGNGVSMLGDLGPIADIRFSHCIFGPQADMLNIQSVQNATVEYCCFAGNGNGVQFAVGSTGVVRHCRFESNYQLHISSSSGANLLAEFNILAPGAQASMLCGSGATLVANHNSIGGGVLVTVFGNEISDAAQLVLQHNDLYNGGGYSVRVSGSGLTDPPFELDFTNNYWGTTDTAQIDAWIWDDADSHRTIDPVVRYLPLRERSIPTARTSISRLKGLFDGPR